MGRGGAAQEQFIVEAIGDLRDMVVGEIMTPRVDVVALSIPVTADDVTRAIRESGHSCFPVYDDNLDDLIGVLYVNDLFRAGGRVQSGRPEAQRSAATDAAPGGAGTAAGATPDPVNQPSRIRSTSPGGSANRSWFPSRDWCSTSWRRCAGSDGRSQWWSTSTAASKGC